jgi:hypothetical protein
VDDSQSPSMFSATSRLVNSLSMNPPLDPRSKRLLASSADLASSAAERSKRVSRPDTVGMKKGAASGALGASFGLLRCYIVSVIVPRGIPGREMKQSYRTLIVSRLSKVCHRLLGIKLRVTNSSDSCSGVV